MFPKILFYSPPAPVHRYDNHNSNDNNDNKQTFFFLNITFKLHSVTELQADQSLTESNYKTPTGLKH